MRVKEIEAAALRVIGRRGLPETTMREIAEEAGLAKGTLYLYFESREELVSHLARAAFEELLAALSAVLERPGPAAGVLEAALRTQVDFFEARREIFRLYLAAAHPGDAAAGRSCDRTADPLYAAYLSRLEAFLSARVERGELLAARPARLALFLAEGMSGIVRRRLTEPDPPPAEEDVRLVLDAVLGGIAAERRTP